MSLITGFHDVRFPTDISYGSEGGPSFSTDVIELSSGMEQRNINWSQPREKWNVAYGVNTQEKLQALITFFYARRGKAFSFRFKNHDDYVCVWSNMLLTSTPGVYQLAKEYTSGAYYLPRKITKPIANTVKVAVDGDEVASNWTVDPLTGLVTFSASHVPNEGAVVLASFQFDVPMRFDTDHLPVNFAEYQARSATVPLIEVRT